MEKVCAKDLKAMQFFIDFSKAFDFIHRKKDIAKLLAQGLPKETVTARIMFYGNIKAMTCSPDGDTDFFDIVTGVL